MWFGIAIAVLWSCDAQDAATAPSDGPTDPETSTTATRWPHAVPTLDAGVPVPGDSYVLTIDDLPPNARVTAMWSTSLGDDVVPGTTHGTDLASPTVLFADAEPVFEPDTGATGHTGDEAGELVVRVLLEVPDDLDLSPRFYQALVEDLDSGTSTLTNLLQRDPGLVHEQVELDFELANASAALGAITVRGNTHTGGVGWIDFNRDFLPDLFVSNGGGADHYLFRNEGDGTFTDVSARVSKPDLGLEDAGVKFADVDNDGHTDLIIPVDNAQLLVPDQPNPREGGPNLLYRNKGNGFFEEVGEAYGLVDPEERRTSAATLADYDGDGYVDIWLGNWAMAAEPLGVQDNFDRLLRFDADQGKFVIGTTKVGGMGRDALTGIFFDVDLDGRQDLYVGNVAHTDSPPEYQPRDVLYRNLGDGDFGDVTSASPGVGDDADAAMGIDIADIDHDGDWDMYITDWWAHPPAPFGNALYLGQEDGTLSDNTCDQAEVCTGYISWPANFVDFDRDGWDDLYVGTAQAGDPDIVYLNDRDGSFTPVYFPVLAGSATKGGAAADFDADGRMDYFVWSQTGTCRLYHNVSVDDHHWVELRLEGVDNNKDAIGAVVRITAGDTTHMRRVSGGDSAHSQSMLTVHFGLGEHDGPVDLEITWPDGSVQSSEGLTTDRFYRVREHAGVLSAKVLGTTAEYDADLGVVELSVTSNYFGRDRIEVVGLGDLTYSARLLSHQGVVPVPTNPGTVTVVSLFGDEKQIPVTERTVP